MQDLCWVLQILQDKKLVKKLNFVFPQQMIKMYLISLYGMGSFVLFVLLKVLINTLLLTNKLKTEFFGYLTESPIIIKCQTPQPTRILASLAVPAVGGCESCSPWSLAQKSWAAQGPPGTPECSDLLWASWERALRSNSKPSLTISCFKSALSAGFLIKLGKQKVVHRLHSVIF